MYFGHQKTIFLLRYSRFPGLKVDDDTLFYANIKSEHTKTRVHKHPWKPDWWPWGWQEKKKVYIHQRTINIDYFYNIFKSENKYLKKISH